MREILFRGKRLNNGEWIEGSLLDDGNGGHFICPGVGEDKTGRLDRVHTATVGQYTGLTDKNGKRIFEGDRVVYPDSTSCSSYDDYNEGIVDYDEETMRFYFTDRWFVEMEDFDVVNGMMVDVQVIGNIHDNQEMLGGGGDG